MAHDRPAARDVLLARERDVLDQLRRASESAEPPSLDEEIGRLTRMDALQQQQMALHARRRLETMLARVRGALARVEEGTYGRCAMCGEPVEAARIASAPETPFCVACQTRIEESQAG